MRLLERDVELRLEGLTASEVAIYVMGSVGLTGAWFTVWGMEIYLKKLQRLWREKGQTPKTFAPWYGEVKAQRS